MEAIHARFVHQRDELGRGPLIDLHDEEAERVSDHVVFRARFPDDLEEFSLLEVKEAYLSLDNKLQIIILHLCLMRHNFLTFRALKVSFDIGVVAAEEVGEHADVVGELDEEGLLHGGAFEAGVFGDFGVVDD